MSLCLSLELEMCRLVENLKKKKKIEEIYCVKALQSQGPKQQVNEVVMMLQKEAENPAGSTDNQMP